MIGTDAARRCLNEKKQLVVEVTIGLTINRLELSDLEAAFDITAKLSSFMIGTDAAKRSLNEKKQLVGDVTIDRLEFEFEMDQKNPELILNEVIPTLIRQNEDQMRQGSLTREKYERNKFKKQQRLQLLLCDD